MGVDFIVSVYSTDLSDGAGEGKKEGQGLLLFIIVYYCMMANCVLLPYPKKITVLYTITSTSNPFLCAADFFLQLGSCKEAVR